MNKPHPMPLLRIIACLAMLAGLLAAAGLAVTPAVAVNSPKTLISSNITTSTTWTLANSPYLVTAPIAVAAAATLTIEPGVEVQFLKATGLRIDGGLQARGTHARQIWLHAAGDDWAGLEVVQPAGDILLQSVTLENGLSGLSIAPTSTIAPGAAPRRVDLLESLLRANTVGVSADYTLGNSVRLTMRNNLITGNLLGLRVNGKPAGQSVLGLSYNSFVSNGIGLKALNISSGQLEAGWQWWNDAGGPQILSNDSLTCQNSAAPAPGSSPAELICGQGLVNVEPFTKAPAGRAIVAPNAQGQVEAAIGAGALNDIVGTTSLVTITVPLNTFSQPVDLLVAPRVFDTAPPGQPTQLGFEVTAAAGGQELRSFNGTKQITAELSYTPQDLSGADANKLMLFFYDEQHQRWDFTGIASGGDPQSLRFIARLSHLSRLRVAAIDLFFDYLPVVQN